MGSGTRRDVLRASALTFSLPVVVVAVVMAVTFVAARSAEGWGGLATVYVGAGVAALLGATTLVVAARMAFVRALPAGRRLAPASRPSPGRSRAWRGPVPSSSHGPPCRSSSRCPSCCRWL